MRCLYLLHHQNPSDPPQFYIIHTNLNKGPLATTGNLNRVALHLEREGIEWQVLSLFPATYTLPVSGTTDKQIYWTKQLKEKHPGCSIHCTSNLKQFYTTGTNPTAHKATNKLHTSQNLMSSYK